MKGQTKYTYVGQVLTTFKCRKTRGRVNTPPTVHMDFNLYSNNTKMLDSTNTKLVNNIKSKLASLKKGIRDHELNESHCRQPP